MGIYIFQYFVLLALFSCLRSEGSSFTRIPFVKLDGNILQAIAVPNILQCCWQCDRLPECLSLNVADVPDKDGLYECQMLRTDTNKYSGLFKPSQRYHHYTRVTDKCETSRCLSGGYGDFHCQCPQGVTGKICNVTQEESPESPESKTYKWLKMNTNPVCFGAGAFGHFYITKTGTVTTVKLVHRSGFVACSNKATGRSNWGCMLHGNFLNAIVTDNKDNKLLPQDEFIEDTRYYRYFISGFTPMSPELIFKNFTTPLAVTAGQEYRIWYGQDLKKFDENNQGPSCTDVYMYGLFDI